jgi:hypothetical protein
MQRLLRTAEQSRCSAGAAGVNAGTIIAGGEGNVGQQQNRYDRFKYIKLLLSRNAKKTHCLHGSYKIFSVTFSDTAAPAWI